MFEKDIYQLIRGLRAHKGNEREYIQDSLKECRKEIRGADMDQKATALLKLVYLEMFGHDMSWASFNVLEVMSSPKYLQKRVGYLAAVQSFRSDTEVLMLAGNLLKKDLNSPDKIIMALPLITIPHVINASMANSLLGDLVIRLSHSNPAIRKKTIVTLYRLALVYPETLRPAWPKIKERLQDENEDPSVTAAIVNVICELGWRRPQDFLPLAPRLFELLTSNTNNWMAIKIIKLFSTLLPLEPRLAKKLLPPLTNIIKTTPAMSLLYECVNGMIQGGMLDAVEGTTEGDEIARLCVSKLRAMLVVEGDPNLRYVALLAFARITTSHADLVSEHRDVILECIDDPDISIRIRALDLVVGMVDANSLQTVVERLLRQLRTSGRATAADEPSNDRGTHDGIVPRADDDDEALTTIHPREAKSTQPPPLPDDYRTGVIERILSMCSKDTYANMTDFEWYVTVLVELVKQCPAVSAADVSGGAAKSRPSAADAIGDELVNVAVRVKAVRPEAASAAQSLLVLESREHLFPASAGGGHGVLGSSAFVAGEFAGLLPSPEAVLTSLIHPSNAQLPAAVLLSYLQAIPKLFSQLTGNQQGLWNQSHASHCTLVIARIVHFLEPLAIHPNLEVQERAVEFLDLMRLTSEAVSSQPLDDEDNATPRLLSQAIPSLFSGVELNPVAPSALLKVQPPEGLDLDAPINANLNMILQQADLDSEYVETDNEVYKFYHEKPSAVAFDPHRPAAELLDPAGTGSSRSSSYQDAEADSNPESLERKKLMRRERNKDDPYYIDPDRASNSSTPLHNILRSNNGDALDVDSIPVMELNMDASNGHNVPAPPTSDRKPVRKAQRRFEVAADETLGGDNDAPSAFQLTSAASAARGKRSLLEVDSSGLASLSLDDAAAATRSSALEFERRRLEEEEMAKAMKEVERLRLEMQRAQEGIQFGEAPEGGTMVVRKKKKKKARVEGDAEEAANGGDGGEEVGVVKKKKKKKKMAVEDDGQEQQPEEDALVAKGKRKKKRQVVFDENTAAD
ncbi:adaptin N terminal region-domain-containing protein [Neohortaea acidophila]|uniref:AP-3 complex subunit delta n=1 Tax=Neohortaea acidophila TaxID=245834 RepID=A0A6A6PM08_9PEZI|nr:adaptin N terminal region-domain-containing protein [Neohortaea acidophila]KAF2481022.1 adaptin N terminal region-domain-containing protein [Neohortaea acidophila]